MPSALDQKVALVTGSGRGIGQAIAQKLARAGARVVINDLDPAPAEETVAEIKAAGGEAVACVGNVTSSEFAQHFVETARREYGSIDIVVNNAGYTWDNVIQKMTDEQWYAMVDVHLSAPFRILRAAQPVIKELAKKESEEGKQVVRKVVNISSIAGMFGNVGQTGYASAKAGVIGLTQTLAKEWGRLNTTVNCVAFGLISTRLTTGNAGESTANIEGREIKLGLNPDLREMMQQTIPMRREGTPDDAAGAVYLFCIPESDYVSGQTLLCSGGLTGI